MRRYLEQSRKLIKDSPDVTADLISIDVRLNVRKGWDTCFVHQRLVFGDSSAARLAVVVMEFQLTERCWRPVFGSGNLGLEVS